VIRICLLPDEADRLDQTFRSETDPKVRDRLLIVRLAHRGRPHQDIAADLAITPRTVQRWLNAYVDKGLSGLGRRKAPGRRPPL
jgi:predicted ArsR family transcriptional regulator